MAGPSHTTVAIAKKDLKPGDHIFAWRVLGLYSHHGIYVGDGQVIHFTTPQDVLDEIAKENPGSLIVEGLDKKTKSKRCERCGYIVGGSPGIGVMKTCIEHFAKTFHLYKYDVSWIRFWLSRRGTCCPYKSKPLEDAVKTAYAKLRTGFGKYNLLTNNCEHFATFCRTGRKFSGQVLPRRLPAGVKPEEVPIKKLEKLAAGDHI
ncbi:LRAT domain-containing protein [Cephalotus follicularis]|uniref:LRAT domain-containing protein n=1 Tax=Cephalotus follicularis TaxID=3775 RepID=A0A1Q3C246_CEPFO|nr:LRAT domain-containing protein [Cephalotus follicularis]